MADVGSGRSASFRSLMSSVGSDAQHLFKAQVELTRTEAKETGSEVATVGGLFGGAAGAGLLGAIFLLVAAAYGLVALGLPQWAGFGIVAAVLLIIATVLGLVGRARANRIQAPTLATAEWERTAKMLTGNPTSESVSGDDAGRNRNTPQVRR
ncbi:MAG: phage holin family protein [Candidatus Nanopelagicales bacterium]|nr:phage holin family protein [Candidatus Nanopelagicales bacterium]